MTFRHEPRAKVIADTVSSVGVRLTTMEVTFHRFVLAEFNTHRAFSRNSASSRAIPVTKQLARALDHPANPLVWASEKKGMQGGTELEGDDLLDAQSLLADLQRFIIHSIDGYLDGHPEAESRLHKSILNRYIEPFMWHTAIVSSTEWENFFRQRDDEAAMPEIAVPARLMREAYENSDPVEASDFQLHLPYYDPEFDSELTTIGRIKVCVARCARVSYLTHDGRRDHSEDLRLFNDTLAKYGHWSPLEHVAFRAPAYASALPHMGNFDPPWTQIRHFYEFASMRDDFYDQILPRLHHPT